MGAPLGNLHHYCRVPLPSVHPSIRVPPAGIISLQKSHFPSTMISSKFTTITTLLLLFFMLFSKRATAAGIVMEWILLKYEIAQLQQEVASGNLQFGICACATASFISSKCKCGETAPVSGKSLHKAAFPSSCLTQPDTKGGKCSVVRIHLEDPASANFVFAQVRLGNVALTQPEHQQLTMDGQRKSIARLTTAEPGKFISIAYSIQLPHQHSSSAAQGTSSATTGSIAALLSTKTASSETEVPHKQSWKNKLKKPEKKTKSTDHRMRSQKTAAIEPPATSAGGQQQTSAASGQLSVPQPTPPPPLCQLIAQMGLDVWLLFPAVPKPIIPPPKALQIRQFLMQDAEQQRVHPQQFDVERYKRAVLQIHNRYRRMHGSDALAHDQDCERSAKHWADSVARQAACLSHEPQKRYGESLFFYSTLLPQLSDPETLAEATVRTFYVEGRGYRPGSWDATRHGHFTQMLWRATRRVGVGVSVMAQPAGQGQCVPGGRGQRNQQAWLFYVVLRYEPPGNIQRWGERSFEENVLEASSRHIRGDNDGNDEGQQKCLIVH